MLFNRELSKTQKDTPEEALVALTGRKDLSEDRSHLALKNDISAIEK